MEQKVVFLVVALIATVSCTLYKKAKKPKDISDEMYCMGCQLVVKELDFILGQKQTRGMGESVSRAMMKVCDEANFKKYEYNKEKVVKVCKALKVDEGLEAVLIKEYGQKHELGKKIVANDLASLICGTVVEACKVGGNIMEPNDIDGGLYYDAESEEFKVKPGRKVRYAGSASQHSPNKDRKLQEPQKPEQGRHQPEMNEQIDTTNDLRHNRDEL